MGLASAAPALECSTACNASETSCLMGRPAASAATAVAPQTAKGGAVKIINDERGTVPSDEFVYLVYSAEPA